MPDDWKNLYSEVKKQKMLGAKKDVVKAVEKHGKILAIKGKYEKPEKVISHCYASVKDIIRPTDVPKKRLEDYDVVLVGCPGNEVPKSGLSMFRDYVMKGGWLLTTDWALRTVVENAFPGYIHWAGEKTDDVVVKCEIADPYHPFLDGISSSLKSGKFAKKGPKAYSGDSTFSWWLEDKSFPITIDRPDLVKVLIKSSEIGMKWGKDPVLVEFDVGKQGGKVIHMISHTHLQKGGGKGKFVSAMIITNILDEKVGIKHGVKKGGAGAPQYVDYYGNQAPQSGIDWAGTGTSVPYQNTGAPDYTQYGMVPGAAPDQNDPNVLTPELSGTAKIEEVKDVASIPANQKCALGDGNFEGYTGKVFKCSGCGTLYHEQCLNVQLQQGICKICERIFLY